MLTSPLVYHYSFRLTRQDKLDASALFSQLLHETMNKYINGHITNEEVIERLRKFAKQVREDLDRGKILALNDEELAFYDALTQPQAVRDFYKNTELVALTRELTNSLHEKRTIDWGKKSLHALVCV